MKASQEQNVDFLIDVKWIVQRKIDISCDRKIKELARKSNLSEKTIKSVLHYCYYVSKDRRLNLNEMMNLLSNQEIDILFEVSVANRRHLYSRVGIRKTKDITFCFSNRVHGWPESFVVKIVVR